MPALKRNNMHPGWFDPRLAACRRLFLRDYVAMIPIGAYAYEKDKAQQVTIQVDIFVPLQVSTPQADQLEEVVDYGVLRDGVRDSIEKCTAQGHVHLQETLCDAIAHTLLAHPHCRAVRVCIEKPQAYPDCAGVGVEVFHIRETQ